MSTLNLQAKPYETYGFTEGSNSPMTSALAFTQNMNEKQSNLNKIGGRRRTRGRRSTRRRRSLRGGDDGSITVPQFPQSGPNLSPINSNTSSVQTNLTSVTTKSDSRYDCYAFGNCPKVGGTSTRRSKQSRSKQSRSKQSRSKQSRSKQSRSKQSKRKQAKSKSKSKRKQSRSRSKSKRKQSKTKKY